MQRERSHTVAKSLEKSDKKDSSSSSAPASSSSTTVAPVMREIPIPRDPARESALSRAVQQIEKQFGKGSVMKLDGENPQQIEGIPTGSLSLDIALGGKGVPKGRVVEVFGP